MSWYIIRNDGLSFLRPGEIIPVMVGEENPNYGYIIEALKKGDYKRIDELLDPMAGFASKHSDRVSIIGRDVYIDGTLIHSSIANKIAETIYRKEDPSKMLRFLDNLLENPDDRAIGELYSFIEGSGLPITDDGYILAYKVVKTDFTDCYTGIIDNSVGSTPKMNREDVCSDPNVQCAPGLHFCSVGYLLQSGYGSSSNQFVMIKVHPRNVVSIPTSYNNSKGRCHEYEVVSCFKIKTREELALFDSSVKECTSSFTSKTSMSERELRDLLGLSSTDLVLRDYGNIGDKVAFSHDGQVKIGLLAGIVESSENVYSAMSRHSYDALTLLAGEYGTEDCKHEFSLLGESTLISILPRLIIADEEGAIISDIPSGLLIKANLHVVNANGVKFI